MVFLKSIKRSFQENPYAGQGSHSLRAAGELLETGGCFKELLNGIALTIGWQARVWACRPFLGQRCI